MVEYALTSIASEAEVDTCKFPECKALVCETQIAPVDVTRSLSLPPVSAVIVSALGNLIAVFESPS